MLKINIFSDYFALKCMIISDIYAPFYASCYFWTITFLFPYFLHHFFIYALTIISCLSLKQSTVHPFLFYKFSVSSFLCDFSLRKNDDAVTEFAGWHSVRDKKDSLIFHILPDILIERIFRLRIQCRRRLIQYDKRRFSIVRPDKGLFLAFSAGGLISRLIKLL